MTVGERISAEESSAIDLGRRVQWLSTESDFMSSPDFDSPEEARRGYEVFVQSAGAYDLEELEEHSALKRREPMIALLQRDPELAAALVNGYDPVAVAVAGLTNNELGAATTHAAGVHGVTDDPAVIRKFELGMLFVAAVAWNLKPGQEFALRLMATMPALYSAEKWIMLGHPESSVWDDEESLVLEFTHATMTAGLTDELYERARQMWGVKGVLRRTAWIGSYITTFLITDLNVSDAERNRAI